MKRIMIIGCCGSGKSTLARQLNAILELELYPLDQFYWKENWVESNKLEWDKTVKDLADKESWIIDGNYGGTIDIRIKRADTIIYLDFSTLQCLWRITKRIIKYHGKVRPDMADGCKERFNLEFYHYVLFYNLRKRKKMLTKLDQLKSSKKVLLFRNDLEIKTFLQELKLDKKKLESYE